MKKNRIKPPFIPSFMLKYLYRRDEDFSITGDFAEEFFDIVESKGTLYAKYWYWKQLFRSLPKITKESFYWRLSMLRNYFITTVRNLLKYKGFSFINIMGMTLGLAYCILIYLFISDELSFDRFHKNADSIYSVINNDNHYKYVYKFVPIGLGPALKEYFPEIKYSVRITRELPIVRYGDKMYKETCHLADSDFFNVFSFNLIKGDKESVLSTDNSVVLSESVAAKYFGNEDPLGKTLSFTFGQKSKEFLVTGSTEDVSSNSTIQFEILINIDNIAFTRNPEALTSFTWPRSHTYIQLHRDTSPGTIENRFPSFVKTYFTQIEEDRRNRGTWLEDGETIVFWLLNLKDVYLHSQELSGDRFSDIRKSVILGGIGILVLLIACINFTNLSIGRASIRAIEIGMKKVMGADRKNLIFQFWTESIVTASFSMILGLMAAMLLLPVFNKLAAKNLSMHEFFTPLNLALFIILIVIVGIAAGSFPGLTLSGFQPVSIFRGKIKFGGKNILTKSLVVIQFSVSIFLIIATLTMGKQINFINNQNLGYDKEGIVVIDTHERDFNAGERIFDFYKTRANSYNDIIGVSACMFSLGRAVGEGVIEINGIRGHFNFSEIYYDYFKTMGIRLLEGRSYSRQFSSDSASVVVNQEFVNRFNIEEPIGMTIGDSKIIGVVENYNYRSLKYELEPVIHNLIHRGGLRTILVRISSQNIEITLATLKKTWKEIQPDKPFTYNFLDEDLSNHYNEEKRWSSIVLYSSVFAIFITCMGLIGITMITISRKIKEIGIRKVVGASIPQIVRLLINEFYILVIIGNLIAWPVAYYFMNKWLQEYAFRTTIDIGIFLLAGIIAFLVAFLTISFQTVKAAAVNPVECLRNE